MKRRLAGLAMLSGTLLLLAVSPAGAREKTIKVSTPSGPCPMNVACNKVEVRQIGPAAAKKVLVLIPGTQGGVGDFTLMARELVKQVRGRTDFFGDGGIDHHREIGKLCVTDLLSNAGIEVVLETFYDFRHRRALVVSHNGDLQQEAIKKE